MGKLEIHVKTADKKGAGSHIGEVNVRLYDKSDKQSDVIQLSHNIHLSFGQGKTDKFPVPKSCQVSDVSKVELWKHGKGAKADWFCELINIVDITTGSRKTFPIHRWIQPDHHYFIVENYTFLPQNDPFSKDRRDMLEQTRAAYSMGPKVPGIPPLVDEMPPEECFSYSYKHGLDVNKLKTFSKALLAEITHRKWKSFDDLLTIYDPPLFPRPKCMDHNSLTDDYAFGAQRVVGCNPTEIKLCTSIPEKLAIKDDMLRHHLEGMTLDEAVAANRLFIIDYPILKDFPTLEGTQVCAPIALFFLTGDKALMPVAIQLFQDPSPDNPVFTPSDPKYTWQAAKLWFNNADATIYEGLTHLGFTHLLMEGVVCATHRQLAPQHPIFRLLAPHFLFLIAVNTLGLGELLADDGWVEAVFAVGRDGFYELLRQRFVTWRLDVEGTLPNCLKERGVLSEDVLPHYGYRDDAMLYYNAIQKYVAGIVSIYYTDPKAIADDYELQAWAEELTRPLSQNGVGLKGFPNDGRFETIDDIVLVCTCIIFTCSVQHAAVNFGVYDEAGYPQNYPSMCSGSPPKSKEPLTEHDVLEMHPSVSVTVKAMAVAKILSNKATNSLGDWEMRYQYDPRALEVEEKFRSELEHIGKKINHRNKMRPIIYQYDSLTPDSIPNAISI